MKALVTVIIVVVVVVIVKKFVPSIGRTTISQKFPLEINVNPFRAQIKYNPILLTTLTVSLTVYHKLGLLVV